MTLSRTLAPVAIAAALGLSATSLGAQDVRLPPSVGATPIEIPYVDPDAPMVINPNTLNQGGRIGDVQPLPMPGPGRVSGMPVPIQAPGITQVDPRRMPGAFSATPIEIPRIARTGQQGPFTYAVLQDGTIYGDTNFGYARFQNMDVYDAFLRSH